MLFLNKCDILRAKLESGIRLGDYITSYGNRPNDFESASTCQSGFDSHIGNGDACPAIRRPEEKVCWIDERARGRQAVLLSFYLSHGSSTLVWLRVQSTLLDSASYRIRNLLR